MDTPQWQDIRTAPIGDFKIWTWNERTKEPPDIRAADGSWWRYILKDGLISGPTHWMEFRVPEPPRYSREGKFMQTTTPAATDDVAWLKRSERAQRELAVGLNRKLMEVERQLEAALTIIAEDWGGGRDGALELVKDEVERGEEGGR